MSGNPPIEVTDAQKTAWQKARALFEAKRDCSGGPDACWPWLACVEKGYGRFRLDGRIEQAHRVAFLFEHGRWPEPEGCHSCDDRYPAGDITYRACCNPAHIFEGTHATNLAHMVATGRSCKGERSGRHKLTEAEARALLALRGTMSQSKAAALFEVSAGQVGRIWTGENWAHL